MLTLFFGKYYVSKNHRLKIASSVATINRDSEDDKTWRTGDRQADQRLWCSSTVCAFSRTAEIPEKKKINLV